MGRVRDSTPSEGCTPFLITLLDKNLPLLLAHISTLTNNKNMRAARARTPLGLEHVARFTLRGNLRKSKEVARGLQQAPFREHGETRARRTLSLSSAFSTKR